jgi:succinate-semialdehyde dehydrogenase/glutarate-semialdehyde dehydrogenase
MSKMVSINPATEEVMASFDCISEEKATGEVKRSKEAFRSWSALDVSERCAHLARAGSVLRKNSRSYGELMAREMGKPLKQAVAEAEKCAWACEYYAENAPGFLSDEPVETGGGRSYVMFQPLGTILGVMPWNFPFWQVFRFAASTLAAGNCVVVKHSSNVPQCGIAIEEAFREAGFPDHVYKNLLVPGAGVRPLVEKNLFDGLSLTGSTEAGSKIGELAGRNIKKVVLELGGNDPFIVLDDAEPAEAAEAAVTARFQNNGQSCIAAKRFIVHKGAAEGFRKEFVARVGELVLGDPMDERTSLGPLARADLRDAIEAQLGMMKAEGAKVLAGGKRPGGKGYFFEPTVVEAPKGSAAVRSQETFGPLASMLVGENDEELLHLANLSDYGLSGSVWSGDRGRAENLARRLECGMAGVNSMPRSDPRMPFGGVKRSGLGRELGRFGIMEFVDIKSVVVR